MILTFVTGLSSSYMRYYICYIFVRYMSMKLGSSVWNIRICHECEVRMDKSVPRGTVWHHEALPSDAKQ